MHYPLTTCEVYSFCNLASNSCLHCESHNGLDWKGALEVTWSNLSAPAGSPWTELKRQCPSVLKYLQARRLQPL